MERASSRQGLPAGAVVMSQSEASRFTAALIRNHKPLKDVFFLQHGSGLAGTMASITSVTMLHHLRKYLGLFKEAAISSSLAALFVPCSSAFAFHYFNVTPPILIEQPYCKGCLELKACGIQMITGVVVPCVLSSITACMTATMVGLHVPKALQPIQFIKFSWELANKGNGRYKLAGCLVMNILGSILLVQKEAAEIITFKKRLQARREIGKD